MRLVALALVLAVARSCQTPPPAPTLPPAGISWLAYGTFAVDTNRVWVPMPAEQNRIKAWQPAAMQVTVPINVCCPAPGVYDWSAFDALIASNHAWFAPYGSEVDVQVNWGWHVTVNKGVYTTNSPNVYDSMPMWFYNLAGKPMDISGGALPGSQLFDSQVPAAAQIVSNFLAHEAGKISTIGLASEPDWGTNYAIPLAMIASSVCNVARAGGIAINMGQFGSPVYGVFTSWFGYYNGSNWYDAITWHDDHWIARSPDGSVGYYDSGIRYDQLFDKLASLGKPMSMENMEIFYGCDPAADAVYADRIVKGVVMMRKSGVRRIAPYGFQYGAYCGPYGVFTSGVVNGYNQCDYCGAYLTYTNDAMTATGQAMSNLIALIGNNACSTSSVQYPYYYYRFGSNSFVWLAEGFPARSMALSNWSASPAFVRDGSPAPTNSLGNSPIVLQGNGVITTQ